VRPSIIAAGLSDVGKCRDHNEDSFLVEPDDGIFIVCDGMGGHAAGEVASAIGVRVTHDHWVDQVTRRAMLDWAETGTLAARRTLLHVVKTGVLSAHQMICTQADSDLGKRGMGTTFTGVVIAGGDAVVAHAGDSRAYLVRGGIAMQLTEDHTLLARLLAAGMPVDRTDESHRWKGVITNALGFGDETKVVTFLVPLSDGDRLLLCSDGVSEYVSEAEVGEVLCQQPSPARAAQRLIDLALSRGGEDNATAVVIKVLEVGATPIPAEQRRRDDEALALCPLLAPLSPQQRLRALRIATGRDFAAGDVLPEVSLESRVAWIVVEGEVLVAGVVRGAGTILYPEAQLHEGAPRRGEHLAIAIGELRALVIRVDDFAELCNEDPDLAEPMYDALGALVAAAR
jgi:serine/threonine protein phosphatase PrpC